MKAAVASVLILACALMPLRAAASQESTDTALAARERADAAYLHGDTDGALSGYRNVVGRGTADATVWTRIGNLEWLQNAPQAATDAYEVAVRLDPMDNEAWHNLAIIRLRQAQAMLERERAALRPGNPRAAAIACEQAALASMLHDHDRAAVECAP
ncbi:MAG: hypothetical protein JSR34_00325 [Proteobacteria bacterium]|nr:hypothetical protein [Pseudomonadota bacterium]